MSKENWLLFKEGEAARSLKGSEQARRWRQLFWWGKLGGEKCGGGTDTGVIGAGEAKFNC